MKKNKAFTLIEILVAIAIVGILATVVMVQFAGYSKKARESKALAHLSSTIPSIISCWGNGGKVKSPTSVNTGGGDICFLGASYGQWPQVGSGTDLNTFQYGYDFGSNNGSGNWGFNLHDQPNDVTICCNSAMKNCKRMQYLGCTTTSPTN